MHEEEEISANSEGFTLEPYVWPNLLVDGDEFPDLPNDGAFLELWIDAPPPGEDFYVEERDSRFMVWVPQELGEQEADTLMAAFEHAYARVIPETSLLCAGEYLEPEDGSINGEILEMWQVDDIPALEIEIEDEDG